MMAPFLGALMIWDLDTNSFSRSEPLVLLSISKLSDDGALLGCPDDYLDMISNSGKDLFFNLSLLYYRVET